MEPRPNDGVVVVSAFRTQRQKQPTVGLMYKGGSLSAVEDGHRIAVPVCCRLKLRMLKKVPNSVDVVRRPIAAINKDFNTSACLTDEVEGVLEGAVEGTCQQKGDRHVRRREALVEAYDRRELWRCTRSFTESTLHQKTTSDCLCNLIPMLMSPTAMPSFCLMVLRDSD